MFSRLLPAVAAVVVVVSCGTDGVRVNAPPTATIQAPGTDTTVVLGEAVTFLGTASDSDGTVVRHAWAFGDGTTSSVEDPGAYTYAGTGVYVVTYRVTDDGGEDSREATRTVTVSLLGNEPPTAAIDAPGADTTVTLGEAVTFLGTASDTDGAVVSHAWAFGDGSTSAAPDPGAYVYATPGAYDVTYQVVDDDGAPSATATRRVTVIAPGNQPPVAVIDAPGADTTVTVGESVTFLGTASDPDGTVVSHAWAFGDGSTSAMEDPGSYTYSAPGSYAVTYQVTDDGGAPSPSATRRVTVADTTSGQNYAMRFYGWNSNNVGRAAMIIGGPSVPTSPEIDVGAGDFTIEFWVRGLDVDNPLTVPSCNDAFGTWIWGNIIVDRDRLNQGRSYGISFGAGVPAFGVADDFSFYTACATTNVLDGQWHHLAFTRSRTTGQLAIYVDGVREAAGGGPTGDVSYPDNAFGGAPRDPEIVLGSEKHDAVDGAFNGEMDELRFSDNIRYTQPSFTPPSSRFVTDGNTVGLFHFDEGSGTVIRDTSGAPGGGTDGELRIGGSPTGPIWVISTAPTGND